MAAAIVILVVTGGWFLLSPEATRVKAGHAAPDLELPSLGGGPIRISQYRGKPVLLVFFKSDCHLCQKEVPQIERVHRERLQQGLVTIGVAVDRDPERLAKFVKDQTITFYVLQDPDAVKLREVYGSYKMPEAYLIDAQGRVDSVYLGAVDWSKGPVVDRIQALLAAARPRPRP